MQDLTLPESREVFGNGHTRHSVQLLHDGKLVAARRLADALQHGCRELVRRGSGKDDDRIVVGIFSFVLLGNVPCNGGMRVAEIVIVPPHLADGGFRAFVIAEARPEELLQLCKHLRRHIVAAAGGKLFHQTGDQAVIAGEQVQQALEIAGNENIHGRG